MANDSASLPASLENVRKSARKAMGQVVPAGAPKSPAEPKALMLAGRTDAGKELPPYYLVYFLLVDLLAFPKMGQWEKVAWSVPVRYQGRLYSVEHRKMGLGIFAPTFDPNARMSGTPSDEAEADAEQIAETIRKAVRVSESYFEWRAEQAARGSDLNVVNNSHWLFERYSFFRDRSRALLEEAERRKDEKTVTRTDLGGGMVVTSTTLAAYQLWREANWTAQAAVEAFFSWTEQAFIHLAILQGMLRTGEDVARTADAEWKVKFKSALDVTDEETKKHYDRLLELRVQIRNFMAHGAFGKRGEAFRFHSGAGAVPLLLTGSKAHRYALTGRPAFDEGRAIEDIEAFLAHLWSGKRTAAREYLFSHVPTILTYASDGTYARAMGSEAAMKQLVERLTEEVERAANMDW
jgi:hypothetical protein